MFTTAIFVTAVLCTIGAWIYSIAFLALVAENHRFWRVHQKKPAPFAHTYARANVIIPCKGMEHQLRENLTAFLQQDHPNYEITFVVERADDSSVQLIRNLQKENRCVHTRLVIAGRTEESGQKVHNLRFATADLSKEVDVLVFADSDANPKRTWLRWLVSSVGREGLGARTGYRWMVPKNKKLPTLLGCTINNALASMLGRGKHYLVWGGSWAIHRNIFDAVGIREAWSGVLSDDLVASRALHSAKLDVEFEPQCVCTTVVDFTWRSLTEFMRRQLLIGRRYAPVYWATSLAVTIISQIGFWGGLIGGLVGISQGASWGIWALGSALGLYALGIARAGIRQNIGRSNSPQWRSHRRARKFDLFAGPFTGFITGVMMLMSMFGNTVSWRGIRYFVSRGGRVLLVGRALDRNNWPVNTTEGPAPETPALHAAAAAEETAPATEIASTTPVERTAPQTQKTDASKRTADVVQAAHGATQSVHGNPSVHNAHTSPQKSPHWNHQPDATVNTSETTSTND